MLRRLTVLVLVAGVCLAGAYANGGFTRCSATEKGSVLMYPKVELRWNAAGDLIQDTFITLNNDFNAAVNVLMYFISGDYAELCCVNVDNDIVLSQNEPAYWSAATGLPKGVSPFTVLGAPYADPEGSGDLILRGYIILWAIDVDHNQIRWNHLSGGATIVNYAQGWAWEYNTYAFAALGAGPNGGQIGVPGQIKLDGVEYDMGFNKLLLDFFAVGSQAFSGGGRVVEHDTDLTLMFADEDLRQDHGPPYVTKANFEIWNENEVSFSGAEYCIIKWDERLLSDVGGHFLLVNLQTNKGRARIDGLKSVVCDGLDDPCGTYQSLNSSNVVLLGLAAKYLTFDGSEVGVSGTNLAGTGTQATGILYDIPTGPEEKPSTGGLMKLQR